MSTANDRGKESQVGHGSGPTVVAVRDLSIGYAGGSGDVVPAVRGVDLQIGHGEVVALVGESGSGKSSVAKAMLGLHPRNAEVTGSVDIEGSEVVGARPAALRKLRGQKVAMVFQDPMSSLNPVQRIGDQIVEAIQVHQRVSRKAAWARAIDLLSGVGVRDAARRVSQYPHEFSGGMRQRVVIAMAMANSPSLIVADEPTTALDVTVQAQVLRVLAAQRAETDAAMLLVTHDLGIAAGNADRIAVMYAGRIVEIGPTAQVFEKPLMPYTMGLLEAIPKLAPDSPELRAIPGTPALPSRARKGCPFAPRCAFADALCRETEPELLPVEGAPERAVACHHFQELSTPEPAPDGAAAKAQDARDRARSDSAEPVLRVRGVTVDYTVRRTGRRAASQSPALSDVSLEVYPGEVFGLVGESGCGKSTLSRAILNLQRTTAGSILVGDTDLAALRGRALRSARGKVQMVFQDPKSSLDPSMTIEQTVAEPLVLAGVNGSERRRIVLDALGKVDLDGALRSRYPHQLSGGQQQRVAIARALVSSPEVLVLDEPVSALDVSVQASVVNLLARMARTEGLAQIFIAHDLAVVAHIADRVAVMYRGEIVEIGDTSAVILRPSHPYTRALIESVPLPDADKAASRRPRAVVEEDPAAAAEGETGCPFRSRCAVYRNMLSGEQRSRCESMKPELRPSPNGALAACHFPEVDV